MWTSRSLFVLYFLAAVNVANALGPENVLLVVNKNSPLSREIAHHYAHLRSIPASNLVYLDWGGKSATVDLDVFRKRMLTPLFDEMQRRGIAGQIDCVVYSTDLPYVVEFDLEIPEPKKPDGRLYPSGSITGLTYLWQSVGQQRFAFTGLATNRYMRQREEESGTVETRGFRSWYAWDKDGNVVETGNGPRYLLCAKLGVTRGVNVNTREEILYYIRRSVAADGANSRGTVYFVRNGNVRSTARHAGFPAAVEQLKELGVHAEILVGRLPDRKPDVQGLMIGTSDFDWSACGSRILPGAICENFTSFGGALHHKTKQTTIDVFLRNGAAGTSGTVTEPYAISAKFPAPSIQVHYARGSTMVESFYQSVAAPFQLLIVGDALCRPWKRSPAISFEGAADDDTLSGEVTLIPSAKDSDSISRFELFVDGRRQARCAGDESFRLDTRVMSDGWHRLRIVGIEDDGVENQGHAFVDVVVDNRSRSVALTGQQPGRCKAGASIRLHAQSQDATHIDVFCHSDVIAKIPGGGGTVILDPVRLGYGPVTLQAIAFDGEKEVARSKPIQLFVQRP